MLLANNQKGLAAQAMRELGNIHYHMNNMRYDINTLLLAVTIAAGFT